MSPTSPAILSAEATFHQDGTTERVIKEFINLMGCPQTLAQEKGRLIAPDWRDVWSSLESAA